jgi:hypothetical protein
VRGMDQGHMDKWSRIVVLRVYTTQAKQAYGLEEGGRQLAVSTARSVSSCARSGQELTFAVADLGGHDQQAQLQADVFTFWARSEQGSF